jgi:hypothetical protein
MILIMENYLINKKKTMFKKLLNWNQFYHTPFKMIKSKKYKFLNKVLKEK